MKILLNSLYGATALPTFRYGMNYSILSEAITLSGHRIIQESALCANRDMNKVLKDPEYKEQFLKKLNPNFIPERSTGERMTVVGTDYSMGFSQSLEV